MDLTTHTSLSPIRRGFAPGFVNYKKRYARLAAASDKVYQLLAHGRWFSQGTPASSNTKTGRHDIAEILLKVALKHQIKPCQVTFHSSLTIQSKKDSKNIFTNQKKIISVCLVLILQVLKGSSLIGLLKILFLT